MKKTILLLTLALGLIFGIYQLVFAPRKTPLTTSSTNKVAQKAEATPSKTLKTYTDPSGFSFNYPDNLSLTKNEINSPTTYADIQLTSKDVEGSLNLKISDSKFASTEEWVKANQFTISQTPNEVKLGDLKAVEVTTGNKLLLGALDSGVLFTIETSLGERKDFWMSVYKSVLTDFSFVQPAKDTAASQGASSSDVSFEGEDVVE